MNHERLAVVQEFPDRFVIGADRFSAGADARGNAPGGMTMFDGSEIATVLKKLPPGLGARIATEKVVAAYGTP